MLQLIQEIIQNIIIQSFQNTTKLTSLKLKAYLKIILESIRYLVWRGTCECLCNTWTLQNRHTPVGQIFQMMQNTGQFTKTLSTIDSNSNTENYKTSSKMQKIEAQ